MAEFYKISKEAAESIGYMELQPGKAIDLLAGKQKDGKYLLDEETLAFIKEHADAIQRYTKSKADMLVLFDEKRHEKIDRTKAEADAVAVPLKIIAA